MEEESGPIMVIKAQWKVEESGSIMVIKAQWKVRLRMGWGLPKCIIIDVQLTTNYLWDTVSYEICYNPTLKNG